jgi:aminoglycoside phosphotransferase (APT) family kinase protein
MVATGADAGLVAEYLRRWLEGAFGGSVITMGTPSSIAGGLDSWIHRVRYEGAALPGPWRRTLAVRVKRHAHAGELAEREAAIQGWCADAGYPSPRVLVVFQPGDLLEAPVQVMELVPGSTVLATVTSSPWNAPRLLARLAALQARLHELDPTGFPAGGEFEDLAERRLELVRTTVDETNDPHLADALDRVEALLPRLRDPPAVVCHGDFHPLNVLVDGEHSWVLDWTDAGLGDRHGDVARTALLFKVAAIVASGRAERTALGVAGPWMARRYLRDYRRHALLDPARLALWEPVHLLHGWSQVVGLHSGQFSSQFSGQFSDGESDDEPDDESDDRTSTVPASLGDQLRSWFETAMSAVR